MLGTAAARLGRPHAAHLDEAAALADRMDEIQRTGPVAAARSEAAWLRGDHDAARAIAAPMHAEAVRLGDLPLQAELAARLRLLGQPVDDVPTDLPFALQARGRWREAAEAWERAGCPYHRAAALAEGDDPSALLEALAVLDGLGAVPLARIVRATPARARRRRRPPRPSARHARRRRRTDRSASARCSPCWRRTGRTPRSRSGW